MSQAVAIVTGGGGALGAVTGWTLAARGFSTYLFDADGERAKSAAERQPAGGSLHARQVDVTDDASVDAIVDSIAAERGRIDVLVNMAGVVRNAAVTRIATNDFELTMRTHVNGTLNCMKAAVKAMRERQYGRIVNMSSVAVLGSLGGGSYGAAKGAIEGLSRAAALEWAGRGITVNCVAPGLIDAGMFQTTPPQFREEGIARTPMKRAGTAQEVADAIAFLASPEASFITGQTLFVCGGLSIGF
jgi:3-oxoacyl-[acyl-carrier protein] reductase